VHVGLINGVAQFHNAVVLGALGLGPSVIVESWRVALVEAVQYGPLAPFLLGGEAVAILAVVFFLWERRPFA
jgi:hypothetical protein